MKKGQQEKVVEGCPLGSYLHFNVRVNVSAAMGYVNADRVYV